MSWLSATKKPNNGSESNCNCKRQRRLSLRIRDLPRSWRKHMFHLRRIPSYFVGAPGNTARLVTQGLSNLKMWSKLDIATTVVSLLANGVLIAALGLGLYTRWHYTEDNAILFIAFTALFVFSISLALVYYFSKELVGNSLSRLYIGCMLGVVSFTEHSTFHEESAEITMNGLLVISLILRTLKKLVLRFAYASPRELVLLDPLDSLEMLGMSVAAIATGKDFISISLLILALSLTITSIRLKSFLGLVNLIFIVIISSVFYFPRLLHLSANPFALACFVGRMSFEPIMDLYFCTFTTLDRWRPILSQSSIVRKFLILLIFCLQMTFYGISARQMPNHKEWFIVVPMFAAFSVVWLCYHLVFFITCWQLSNKVTQCFDTYESLSEESRNLYRIMASKGVRHFSLISQRLVLVTVLSSIILGLLGWITKTALSLSLLCMVVPVESAVMSLLWEMGSVLGGTCIGYALVAPALTVRAGVSPVILPSNTSQELSSRATQILSTVQRFFSYHLIETYGCDYSSSGISAESVETKLKAFFQRVTSDGPRFDTYVLYYSGSVYELGDWALAGDSSLKLSNIIEWWQEMDNETGSRLIIVLDSEFSYKWIRDVRRLQDQYVAIQTCLYQRHGSDFEEGHKFKVGAFTNEWMDFNGANINDVNFHEKTRNLKVIYGVSSCWTDFTFHLPTEIDIAQHWNSNFPKVTRPLIKATNFPVIGSLCCCCHGFLKCIKRKRMRWAPPAELDTGHGFRLVTS